MTWYKDTHKRTLFKTISWRVLATLITILLAYIFTSDIVLSTEIGIVVNLVKALIYYIHERIWEKIKWGRIQKE